MASAVVESQRGKHFVFPNLLFPINQMGMSSYNFCLPTNKWWECPTIYWKKYHVTKTFDRSRDPRVAASLTLIQRLEQPPALRTYHGPCRGSKICESFLQQRWQVGSAVVPILQLGTLRPVELYCLTQGPMGSKRQRGI